MALLLLAVGLVPPVAGQESTLPRAGGQQESDAGQTGGQQQGSDAGQAGGQESDAPQPEVETWTTRPDDACVGLTVRWRVGLEALEPLVGPTWTPASAGGEDGRGTLGLFGVGCEDSVIEGAATGPFQMAALIVEVQPASRTPQLWLAPPRAAIPAVVGMGGDPVIELFRRHGFAVSEGDVELHVESAENGARASLRVVLPGERITVQAHLELATEPFAAGGAALMATAPGIVAGFSGPESATRFASGSAAVTTSGDTWPSRLDLGPTPDALALDTRFVWDFVFWRRETEGR